MIIYTNLILSLAHKQNMSHPYHQLNSKMIRFKVRNITDKQIIDNIIQTKQNPLKCCENLVSVGYGGYDVLLFNQNKCMSLQDGMHTVQKELNLKKTPVRITLEEDLPDEFFLIIYHLLFKMMKHM